jgi:selenide,water dikinase
LREYNVHACTDVTGFGLLGHGLEMANNKVTLAFNEDCIPILQSAKTYSDMGIIPAGTYANKTHVSFTCKEVDNILLYDAQTSGGLLVAMSEKEALQALPKLKEAGYEFSAIIGQVEVLKDSVIEVI